MPGDLVYFTLGVPDTARARRFYGDVLGWTFSEGRAADGWNLQGATPPGGLHGGAEGEVMAYFGVDDLGAALAAVRAGGGEAGEPQETADGGYAACRDDQGTPFSLFTFTGGGHAEPAVGVTVTPYLAVDDARAALAFYERAFGAVATTEPIVMDDGRVGHVEFDVGGAAFMLADAHPEIGAPSPAALGGTSVSLTLEVGDPDAVVDRAVAAGATLARPLADSDHGRNGVVVDPFGHRWLVHGRA